MELVQVADSHKEKNSSVWKSVTKGSIANCVEFTVTSLGLRSAFDMEWGQNSALSVYPNPVTDVLNINTGEERIKQVTISDLSGKVVLKATSNQISVQNLTKGMYIVTVETVNGTTTHKVNK